MTDMTSMFVFLDNLLGPSPNHSGHCLQIEFLHGFARLPLALAGQHGVGLVATQSRR
jgi:hypothetical protein